MERVCRFRIMIGGHVTSDQDLAIRRAYGGLVHSRARMDEEGRFTFENAGLSMQHTTMLETMAKWGLPFDAWYGRPPATPEAPIFVVFRPGWERTMSAASDVLGRHVTIRAQEIQDSLGLARVTGVDPAKALPRMDGMCVHEVLGKIPAYEAEPLVYDDTNLTLEEMTERLQGDLDQFYGFESASGRDSRFRSNLYKVLGITDNPKADALFELAWAEGHADGLLSVLTHAEDMAELIS